MSKDDSSKIWSMFSLAASLGGAVAARKAIDKSWQVSTGKKPPENPADPDVEGLAGDGGRRGRRPARTRSRL